jgi:aspartyl-tRNA(Asn)/glutamyl-tRNA(Gln) amidotransferase subunit C
LIISEDTIRHVAKLARLAVTDEEARLLAPQLSDILDYANELQEVDLTDVEPTSHSFPLYNVLRKDEAKPGLSREAALKNAPDSDGGQVRVPAVLEG